MNTTSTPTAGELAAQLVPGLTVTTLEMADWHFLDLTLTIDRNRPLVRLLFELAFAAPAVVDLRQPQRGLAIA